MKVATTLALSALTVFSITACGVEGREVLAHYDDGGLRSEAVETQRPDGAWHKDGAFRAWHPNGELEAEGAFEDGKQHGPWTQWYANGQRGSQGVYDRGAKQATWSYWHESGEKLAEGSLENGVRQGPWTSWYPDGALQTRGSYLFGEKEGVWTHRSPAGAIDEELTGVYEAGILVGEFVIDGTVTSSFGEDRPRERAEFRDGVRHGVAATWHPDGSKRSEGHYADGRKTGRWTYWREDGSIDSARTGVYDGWRLNAE